MFVGFSGEERGPRLNLLGVFFGVGAMGGPIGAAVGGAVGVCSPELPSGSEEVAAITLSAATATMETPGSGVAPLVMRPESVGRAGSKRAAPIWNPA